MRLVRNLNQQKPEKRWNRKIRETREGLQLQIRKEKEHVLYLGPGGGGGGGRAIEARPGTEKRCSHDLQNSPVKTWTAVFITIRISDRHKRSTSVE